jgi:hypothetical protein
MYKNKIIGAAANLRISISRIADISKIYLYKFSLNTILLNFSEIRGNCITSIRDIPTLKINRK